MAVTVSATRRSDTIGHGPSVSPTPDGALALAELALVDLLDSLSGTGSVETFSAQDTALLDAVQEAVSAAHRRFQALRAGRESDVSLWTARLQVAAQHLSRAAL